MLLQGHEHVIRVFPAWPGDQPARFANLRATGAFLVSSEYRDGKVRYVAIESERGRGCTVQNPWPDMTVTLHRNGAASEEVSGARFTFKTVPGEQVTLLPAGQAPCPGDPL